MEEYFLISNIVKFWMALLFGKDSLDGYYTSTEDDTAEKRYIFASVFPSRKLKDIALNESLSGIDMSREKTKHCQKSHKKTTM